jgi:cystathionine beta-lyase/cystathionine gamma-synthase
VGAHTLGVVDDRRWGFGIRIGNPAVAASEERMASLEGGIGAAAASSRQAAELLTSTAPAAAGGHLVASAALDGAALDGAALDGAALDGAAPDGAVRGFMFGVTARNLSQVV